MQIHTAFIHDFARWEDAHVVDIQVSEAIIAALEGTNKPFIATSGSGVLGDTGGSVDESHPIPADYPLAGRAKNENVVLKVCMLAFPDAQAACMLASLLSGLGNDKHLALPDWVLDSPSVTKHCSILASSAAPALLQCRLVSNASQGCKAKHPEI